MDGWMDLNRVRDKRTCLKVKPTKRRDAAGDGYDAIHTLS